LAPARSGRGIGGIEIKPFAGDFAETSGGNSGVDPAVGIEGGSLAKVVAENGWCAHGAGGGVLGLHPPQFNYLARIGDRWREGGEKVER
jgi:hypothetical protein